MLKRLAVTIIPIPKLAFSQFAAFLSLNTKRCNRAGFKAFQAYFFTGFLAEAVCAFLDSKQCRVDFSQKFAFPVPRPEFQPEFGFLRRTVILLSVWRRMDRCRAMVRKVRLRSCEPYEWLLWAGQDVS
jgi:hypothetical protein